MEQIQLFEAVKTETFDGIVVGIKAAEIMGERIVKILPYNDNKIVNVLEGELLK